MWCWSKLSSAKWDDAWTERLAGNPNAVINYIKGGKSIRVEVYCESKADADYLKDYFGGSVRESKSQDWVATQNNTKRPPIKVRDQLLVTENTDEEYLGELQGEYPGRRILVVPAEMAFGTGDHATTSTCMRFIADCAALWKGRKWDMLDLGSGTGILALCARALGAESALGMDFDPVAVEVSKGNAKRNRMPEVEFFQGDVFEWEPEGRTWDLVVANLFSTVLQKAFPRISMTLKREGVLVVSGILADQWEETESAAIGAGLEFSTTIKRGKWVTAMGGWKR